MRKAEVEKFVEKAKGFEDMAKFNFEKKRYDLAIFCLEQASQIYIKAKLLELIGEFPRTHDLVELLKGLSVVYKTKEIEKFVDENISSLTKLVDAYIASLYYTRKFYKEEVEESFSLLSKLKELLEYD